jgi:glutamate/aspartate transport system permease protein
MSAWGWTLVVALSALVVALAIGLLVGIARTTPNKWLAWAAEAWTELFRNIPLIAQLFIWYHVIPAMFPSLKAVPEIVLAIFGLGLFTSARISEQVKAGILTLPKGQRYAGLAMGLSLPQTYRYVLLPVALRIIVPPLTSESMNIIKNSSIASFISITELIYFAQQAGEETSQHVTMYAAVTLLYFIAAFTINRLAAVVETKVKLPGMVGGGK